MIKKEVLTCGAHLHCALGLIRCTRLQLDYSQYMKEICDRTLEISHHHWKEDRERSHLSFPLMATRTHIHCAASMCANGSVASNRRRLSSAI